ncbi:MAG: DUF839 domain-containing protein [Planctomycetota bacterium]
MWTRRSFFALTLAGAGAAALSRLGRRGPFATGGDDVGYGPLQDDPDKILRLPRGFSYKVLSRTGDTMADGLLVPGAPDGMAAFAGENGRTVLVRNHELTVIVQGAFGSKNERLTPELRARLYDAGHGAVPALGGTTTLVVDTKTLTVERQHLSLAGTVRNCAGGATPWGSWLSCEESDVRAGGTFERDHGFCFEVPANATGLVEPVPLVAMGRFYHEAAAVDPATGAVYLTEDRADGLLYRFLPNQAGVLSAGGRLQALVLRERKAANTSNHAEQGRIAPGQRLPITWVDIENPESPNDDLRKQGFGKGAARFARGEGMHAHDGCVWFTCTIGGPAKVGQIFCLRPDPDEDLGKADAPSASTLEIFYESPGKDLLENCDNLTLTPWGDLLVCEDGDKPEFLVGITPEGQAYKFAENVASGEEMTGATFSPDASTLFVNIQQPGMTLAITGPWRKPG